ncbi:AMP-dependent ligase [Sorangium cellulosum]|uniref:AMP-dependent ligase n=1 Tax=Sorangium cellulosum TaxID=56 RepID=A0A2L0F255_SORCE|nr:AMP-binding protein [Sorangium cellulosum]AUX45658.1 AMP-dependent ligase [Sorangium cellulosum]
MAVRDALAAGRRRIGALKDEVLVAGRAVTQSGLLAALRWPGLKVAARELARGKANPSLLFRFYAENSPHRSAVIDPRSLAPGAAEGPAEDRVYSYVELNERIDRLGLALDRRGVGPGVTALVALKNRPEFVTSQVAIARVGGSAVTASWRSTPAELAYLAGHSGARLLLFDADVADMIREAAPRLEGIAREDMIAVGGRVPGFAHLDELVEARGAAPDRSDRAAVVMYTSGTTGKPKGAVRRFGGGIVMSALGAIGATPMRVGDVHLAVCPLYHLTAFGFVNMSFMLGATVVILPEFRPELFLEAIQRYRVTTTAVVPTMLHRVLELGEARLRAYDTSSLTAIFTGGAPLPPALAAEVTRVFGDRLYNFYGATETGIVTIAGPEDLRASPGTIGRPVAGSELLLVGEDGRPCADGEVGELYVRSPLLVSGYHRDPDATRASMLGGYFSVGDLARRDARGCYHVEGRKRDLIISGGVNVYPAEVEAVLHDHPAVAEAAVVGVPDPAWGERARAFIALRPGRAASEDELRAHCRAQLAGPKVPREFVFIDALPRNPTGKVMKRDLAGVEGIQAGAEGKQE